jgi:hypothetical protein
MATKKTSRQAGADQFLSAEEIISGGRELRVLEVPELPKNGKPGIIHLRHLSAGDVLEFTEYAGSNEGEAMMLLISKSVVTPDGKPLFMKAQTGRLREISVDAFKRISAAVAEMTGIAPEEGAEGNALGEA